MLKEACQQIDVDSLDTLHAAELRCSVSDGPVKINLETSASGGHSEDKTLNRNVNARLEIRYRNYVARRQVIKSLRTPLREMRT